MIAKRIPTPKKSSSFKRLSNYIADAEKQQGIQRLTSYLDKPQAVVQISNCCFDGLPEALKEITATQKKNTRSKNEKTYHLVISFREGEQPDDETLSKVEDTLCDRIGFKGHQRVSALHTDTNNWHLHVAINKVHPGTFRNVEPFYDKFKMSEACRDLEKEFNLLPDNGIQKNRKTPMNPATDKEAHTGIQSLISWIRENASKEIQEVLSEETTTWSELHKIFNTYGLMIRPRGAGFVVQDLSSGLTVKASSVDRSLSKKKLEMQLGVYQEPQTIHSPRKKYTEGPVQQPSSERDTLWKQYQNEKETNNSIRKEHLQTINAQRRGYLQNIFADIRGRKQEAKASVVLLNWRQKKRVYAALQVERLKALEKASTMAIRSRELVNVEYPGLTWTAFLQKEAENGNETAVKMLRQGKGRSVHDKANYIAYDASKHQIYQDMQYHVDKRGRIKYKLQNSWVLDAGGRVQPGSTSQDILIASLQIAIGKYGRKLQVQGDRDFIERVSRAAKSSRLNVSINGQRITVNKDQQQRGKGTGR